MNEEPDNSDFSYLEQQVIATMKKIAEQLAENMSPLLLSRCKLTWHTVYTDAIKEELRQMLYSTEPPFLYKGTGVGMSEIKPQILPVKKAPTKKMPYYHGKRRF